MRIFALLLSGLILALVKDGQARSVEGSLQCATTCADPVMMQYTTGSSHEFTYAANIQHSFNTNAGPDQTSILGLQIIFRIDVLAPCEHVLTVTQAYIDNGGDLDQWQNALMQNPLHFSYQDGVIPSVCASNNDPTWVLNIKRGILSSLQVSTTSTSSAVPEIDVTGECEVDYTVEDSMQSGVTITKVKDYSKCVGRQQELMFSHFTPFNTGERQDFVNSYQQCTQRLQRGQIAGTECIETHTFRPFSNEESGANTVIRSTVTRTGSRRSGRASETLASSNVRRTTLGFEKETDVVLSHDITEIRAVFEDICQTLDTEHYQQVGKDFIKLIFLLRRLDAPAIEQAYSSLHGACNLHNDALKGMFVDALQWCGSEGCVVFSTTLIAAGPEELDDATSFRWLFGMSLITKPTLPMLDGLTNVVESGRFVEQSYLTAGSMIQKICVDQPNCLAAAEITRALRLFESKLGVNCRTSDMDQKQQILLALRAIGNAGRTNSVSILSQCARETQNDMDTRIAAIQAFRRMPCGTDRSLSSIFFDEEDDSEARINAYLSLMQCPTARFIQQVKAMLTNEPVLQVSNFVWSHLKQIAESNDPLKGYMKPLLIDLILTPPHELDPRKYSRFYEASFYSEGLNAGATVESSLIWSPKSFVPRSAGLNMTVDIFGQAVNLFEIGGRVEGVESFVKSMLQSDSFKSSPIGKIFVTEEDDEEDVEETMNNRVSDIRSADAGKIIEVTNEFKRGMPEEKSSASWFLRVFGNEMFYSNSQFEKSVADEIAESSEIKSIISQIAQGKAYNYHDDMLIINSAHVLPTGVGLPLELAFNGSVSIDLKVQGQLDMSGLFASSPSLAFKADVNPRATIVFNGAMSVDAHVTRSGIQTESTSLTSWKIGGTASVDRGQAVSVRIDTPYDRNTVVNFEHKLMKIEGDNVIDMATSDEVAVVDDCTSDFAGHRLCLTQPSASDVDSIVFPSSGAVSYSVHAEKTDADLTHFLLTGNYEVDFESGYIPRSVDVNAKFETPGSSIDRLTKFTLYYDIDDMVFRCNIKHPDLDMTSKVLLINEANKKRASFMVGINGDTYQIDGGIKREVDGQNKEWVLDSSLALPSLELPVSLDATLAYTPSSSISLESRIENAMSEPIVFNSRIENLSNARKQKLRFQGNGEVRIPSVLDSSYRFDFNFRPKTDVYQVTLDYTIGSNDEESVKVQYKLKDRSTEEVTKWTANHLLTSTQFPSFNHDIELKYLKSDELVQSSVEVQYGERYKKNENQKKVVVKQEFGYASSSQLHGNMEIEVPELGIDNKINFNFTSNDTAVDMSMGYNGIQFGMVAIDRSEDMLNKAFNLYVNTDDVVQAPIQSIKLETYIEETSSDVYQLGGDFSIGKTKDMAITATINVENLSDRKSLRFDVTGKNDVQLLAGHSIHDYSTPSTFTTENGFTYGSNSGQLNGQYEGQKQGGFETSIEYRMNQNTRAALQIDFESDENSGSKLIKVTFKDGAGRDRFAQVEATTNSQATSYAATAEFTSDIAGLPFQSLQLNLNTANSASSFTGDVNAMIDNNEILGFGGAYEFSDETTIDLTARQALTPGIPQDYAFKVAYGATTNGGFSATVSYTQDKESDVVADLDLSFASNEYTLKVSQSFSERMPPSTKFTVSLPGDNRLNTELAFFDNVFSLGGSFSASALNIDFEQSGSLLTNTPVPSTLNSVVSWGTRQGDGKQGLWIVTSVDDSQTISIEFMLESAVPEVSARLTHNVQALAEIIPQVDLTISPVVDMNEGTVAIALSLDVDENRMLECNIERESDSVRVNFVQTFTQAIPQTLELKGQGHWSGLDSADFETSFLYNEAMTKLSGELGSGMVKVTYLSDCEWMKGDVDVQLDFSGADNSFTLTYTNTGVEKTATGSFTYDVEAFEAGFVFSQNLYSDESMTMIPEDISVSFGYTGDSVSVDGKYNDYTINAVESWKLVGSKYVCTTKMQQNIFSAVNTLNARQEIDINPYTSFGYSVTYRIDNRPSAMISLDLSTNQNNDGTVTLSADMKQTERFFTSNEVPQSINVGLTYPSDASTAAPKVALTLDVGTAKSLQIGLNGDWTEKQLNFMFSQEGYLTDLSSVSYSMKASVPETMEATNAEVALDQELTINDDSYQVGLSGGYSFNAQTSTVTLDLGMMQTIPMLIRYSVPSSLQTSTTAHYGFGQNMAAAGQSTFEITVSRTMTDPVTGDQAEYTNSIDATLELELFNYHAAFTLSHDFGADSAIPENVKVEITASSSGEESDVVYKSVKLALTLDETTEQVSGTVNYNPVERTFYLSTNHDFEDLLYYGVPEVTSVSFRMANDYDIDLKISSDDYQKRIGFEFDLQTEKYMLKFNAYHDFDYLEETLLIPKQFGVETETSVKASAVESELRYVWGDLISKAQVQSRWNFASNTPSFDFDLTQNMTASKTFPQQVSAQFNVRGNQFNNMNLMFRSSVGDFTVTCDGNMIDSRGASGSLTFEQTFSETPFQSFTVSASFDVNDLTRATLMTNINVDNNDLLSINLKETTDVNDMSTLVKLSAAQGITNDIPHTIDLSVAGNVTGPNLATDITVSIDGGKDMTVSFNTGINPTKKTGFLELTHGQKKWSKKMNIPRVARLDGALSQNDDGNQLVIKLKRGRTKEKIILNFNSRLEADSVFFEADYSTDIPELDMIPETGAVAFFGQASWESIAAKFNFSLGEDDFKHALEASYEKGDSAFGYNIEFKQDNKYLNAMNVPALIASSMHLDWANAYSGSISGTYGDDYVTLSLSSNLKNKANMNLNFNVASVSHALVTTVTVANEQANLVVNFDGDVHEATLSAAMSEGYARVGFNHDFTIPMVPKDVTGSVTWRMDPNIYAMVNVTVDGHPYSVSSSFKRLEDGNQDGFYAALTLFNIVREITFLQDFSDSKVAIKMNHNIDEIISYVPGTVALNGGLENGALNLGLTVDETEYTFAGEADLQQMKFSYEHNIDGPWPKVMAIQMGGSMEPLHGKLSLTVDDDVVDLEGKLDDSSAMLSASHNIRSIPIPRVMSAEVSWGMNPIMGKLAVKYDDRLVDLLLNIESDNAELKMTQNIISDIYQSVSLSGDFGTESSGNANGQMSLVLDDNTGKVTFSIEGKTFVAELTHDFEDIPIPSSITFTETYTVAPYSCQMALNYGDDVYTLGGELDLTAQRISANQNIPQLNALGVPAEVSLQVRGSTAPLSGELIVSIDGAENKIAAGLDTDAKVATFNQDFGYGFPEDIELALSGSLSPLSGKISLSIDGLDRAVAVDSNSADMQYAMSHSVPELKSYIPENLSFGLTFTSSSFDVNAGFTMDGTDASYSVSGSFDENHIDCSLTHNCDFLPLPKNMQVSLAGSLEFKNASASVAYGDNVFVNTNVNIMTGETDEWYGATAAFTHNVPEMTEFGVPMNNEFTAKGKLVGTGIQVQVGLESGSMISYSGELDASFSNGETKQLQGSYTHVLDSNEFNCATTLVVDYTNARSPVVTSTSNYATGAEEKTIRAVLSADIRQTNFNTRLNIRVRDNTSNQVQRSDSISLNCDLDSLTADLQVSQPELNEFGVPMRSQLEITMPEISNGRTFAINVRLDDQLIVLEGQMPEMAWSNFEIQGRFVQNMCDFMPQNISTILTSSYDIIDNMKLVADMKFDFGCDETSIMWTRHVSLSPTAGNVHSKSLTNIPAFDVASDEVSDFTFTMARGALKVDLSNTLNGDDVYTFNLHGDKKGAGVSFDLYIPYRISFATSAAAGRRSMEIHSNLDLFSKPLYNLDIAAATKGTSTFDFSLSDLEDDSSVAINYAIQKGTVSLSVTNDGYSSFLANKLAFEVSYIERPLTFTFAYNEEELHASLDYDFETSMEGSFNIEQTICDWTPSEIIGTLSFSQPRLFNINLVADDVTLFIIKAGEEAFTAKVNDLENSNLFSCVGSYTMEHTTFTARVELAIPPVEFAYVLDTEASMFEQGNGESTIVAKVMNSNTEEQITLDILARPTAGGHSADFFAKVELHSTYPSIPLDMIATYNSDFEESTSTYSYDFVGDVNKKTLSVSGEIGARYGSMSLNAKQTFSDSIITFLDITVDTTTVSDFEKSSVSTLAWDDFDATITVAYKSAATGYLHSNIVHPGCTMYDTGCSDMTFNVDWQVDGNAALQAKVLIDEAKFLVDATYEEVSNHHTVNIDLEQDLFTTFPYQTTSVIDVLAQGSMFSFEGHMDSPTNNLITLSENFNLQDGVLSNELLYKFFTSDLTYFKSDVKVTYDGMFEVYTSAQVNSMPEMSALARFNMEAAADGNNNTVTVQLKSGPLSKFVGFRKFASGVWYQETAEGDEFFLPKFGGKVKLDSDVYFMHTTNDASSGAGKDRYNVVLSLQHPHDVNVFGYQVPKSQDISFGLLKKGYAGKLTLNYNNDLLADEIRLSNKLRLFRQNKLVELSMTSVYDHVLPYTIEFNVEKDTGGFDYMVSGRLQLRTMIDVDYAFGVVNSDEKIGFDITMTNNLVEETHEVSGYYMYVDQTIMIDIVTPGRDPIHLTGDLKELISQARDAISRIMSEATSSSMKLVKGIEKMETGGYDLYIGYSDSDDMTYTLHLVLAAEPKRVSAALQIKENFNLDSEVAVISMSVPEGRSVKIEMSANPALANFIQDTLFTLNGEFSQKASWAANNFNDVLTALKTVLTGNDEIEDYTSTYIEQAIARVNSIRNVVVSYVSTATTNAAENIQASEAKTQKMIKNGLGVAVTYISTLNDFVATPFKELVEEYYQVELASVVDFVDEQLMPVKDLLDKVNAGDAFIALVNELLDNALYFVTRNGEATLISTRIPLKDLIVVTNSQILITIPLQFEIDHFVPLPTLSDIEGWFTQTAMAVKINEALEVLFSYADDYYRARALLNTPVEELLPPFKGHFFVSGFRHFSTFDQRAFDYVSDCGSTHVLAADMKTGNFSVSLTYADPNNAGSQNSINVMTGGSNIVINADYSVSVDGTIEQLPKTVGKVMVSREGNTIHVRRSDEDLDVACDFVSELCTIDISPYYFGATAGLAGIYNNEPNDDFTGKSHEKFTDVSELASSWEVSSRSCSSRNTNQKCETTHASCAQLFQDLSSPFRPCFPLVDPAPYMQMCADAMCSSDDESKTCAASAAYQHRCGLVGAILETQPSCIICTDVKGNTFNSTQTKEAQMTGADVVFVVEEGECIARNTKGMRRVFKKLISELNGRKLSDTTYQFVGFGGLQEKPHSYTVDQQLMINKKHLSKTLKQVSKQSTVSSSGDALAAISYASQLPFRSGAKPIIILISCDECSQSSQVTVPQVQSQLERSGISFHHFNMQPIDDSSSARLMYGYNNDFVFDSTNSKSAVTTLTRDEVTDQCATLATSSGGSVWHGDHVTREANFSNLFGQHIASVVQKKRHTCTCALNDAGIATATCTM